jgi:DNA-binding MarR family transcriptional regulator
MHTTSQFMSDDLPLQACHCFATRQAARFVSQIYERHLARAGITNTQFSILALLQQCPGSSMTEMAKALVMDRTTLVRAIAPLQRAGLVEGGARSPRSRVILLDLTEAGRARLALAYPLWRAAQRDFEERIGAEQATGLRDQLLALTA